MNRKRRKDESYEAYKRAQRDEERALNQYLRGRLLWDSKRQGTFRRET